MIFNHVSELFLARPVEVVYLPVLILGDPGAVSRVDKMFVVKVTENFHHKHFIEPTNCTWVSEDDRYYKD